MGPAILFAAFVCLGIYITLAAGSVETNSQHFAYRSLWADYSMPWNEVVKIELYPDGSSFVLFAHDKRLSALGPIYWSGPDRVEMIRLVNAQITSRGIEVVVTGMALLRLSKNTKLRDRKRLSTPFL